MKVNAPSPRGWVWTTLREITHPRGLRLLPSQMPDASFIGLQHLEPHTMRLVGMGQAAAMKSSAAYFGPGDVLYGRLRPYLNKVYKPDFEGLASAEFIVFQSHASLDNGYLQYFLNSSGFVSFASRLNTGDRPRVDFDQLADHLFPFPPLSEQHRIVAEIEKHLTRLDAAVAALHRTQANLKRYRASVLKAACEGRLVPTEAEVARREGRDYEPASVLLERILKERRPRKNEDAKSPDATTLPPLPEAWAWASFTQLLLSLRNGYSKRPDGSEGTPILRISAVRPMSVDLSDVRYVSDEADGIEDNLLSDGDLLFTRYNGNPSLVGVCGLVQGITGDVAHPDKLIRARLVGSDVPPGFIEIAANTGASRDFMARRVRTTAGQSGVSGSDLKQMPVPLPPSAEQKRIVSEVGRRMSVIRAAETAAEVNLRRAARLRQAILKRAFEGKLVPQDPNDEPASALLERIRTERDAEERVPEKRRGRTSRRSRRQGVTI